MTHKSAFGKKGKPTFASQSFHRPWVAQKVPSPPPVKKEKKVPAKKIAA